MKARKLNLFLFIFCMGACVLKVNAQEKAKGVNNEIESKSFQLSFIYPIGTNGVNSTMNVNNFSLNILGGSNGGVNAFEIGGLTNINQGNVKGLQIAGINNINKNVKGIQIAGILNISKDVKGVQIASIINVAKKVKGLQIGLINIADSVNGIPIGLLSIVRNSYSCFEFGASESLFANFSYKIGVPHFYNIFSVGYKQTDYTYWSFGYGIGTMFNINSKININLDLTAHQINENEWYTKELNMLNKLKLNIAYKLSESIELIAGPSFNVMVSEFDFRNDKGVKSSFVPWHFYDKSHSKTNIKMFAGFNAAIRF